MFTRSEDLEDIVKGYLKSGKVLENKLIKMSSLKHAVNIVEQKPIKYELDEDAPEEDDEDRLEYKMSLNGNAKEELI